MATAILVRLRRAIVIIANLAAIFAMFVVEGVRKVVLNSVPSDSLARQEAASHLVD